MRLVSDVDRVERFRLTLRFFDDVSTASTRRDILFQFRLQIFRRRVGIFRLFFLCCFYFPLKVHVNFFSVFHRDYNAVVTSSRHRPFRFHNFVFLLNCLFVSYNAHRISVCVIAVSISHEFLLKVRRLSSFSRRRRLYAFTSTRRNFFHDDARDLTSTTSRRFFHDVGH